MSIESRFLLIVCTPAECNVECYLVGITDGVNGTERDWKDGIVDGRAIRPLPSLKGHFSGWMIGG